MKIYVGNLSYETTEQDLRQEFENFGGVSSVSIVMDKYSGRPKGFAFVEMPAKSEAESAITSLNGKMLNERTSASCQTRLNSQGCCVPSYHRWVPGVPS